MFKVAHGRGLHDAVDLPQRTFQTVDHVICIVFQNIQAALKIHINLALKISLGHDAGDIDDGVDGRV